VRLQTAKEPGIGLKVASKPGNREASNQRPDLAHRFESAASARSEGVKADLPYLYKCWSKLWGGERGAAL
jgi:hypothetical protein